VLLIVSDTLRVDHVYGDGARTPAIDALARKGLSFDRAFPEAMPTVPARNSILAGRRMFPFRGRRDRPGALAKPGWAPFPTRSRRASALSARNWNAQQVGLLPNSGPNRSP
jgi:hypothetical protein